MPEVNEIRALKGRCKQIWIPCSDCGKCRWVTFQKGQPRHSKCRSCAAKGNVNRYQGKGSYIYVLCPEHPKANSDGRVKRCILILEEKLGRYLLEGCEPHHRNEIKDDDRPENLEEQSHGEHARLHWQWRKELATSKC